MGKGEREEGWEVTSFRLPILCPHISSARLFFVFNLHTFVVIKDGDSCCNDDGDDIQSNHNE